MKNGRRRRTETQRGRGHQEPRKKDVRYTASQERLIKARFYRWVLHTHGGKWDRVADDLERVTGCRIPIETLRQNIQPTNKKAGMPPRSFQDPARLQALCDFVIEAGFLKQGELTDDPGHQALFELQAFLSFDDQGANAPLSERLGGEYECDLIKSDYTSSILLRIAYADTEHALQVTEIETTEGLDSNAADETIFYEGWAVVNNAGMYLLFLRNTFERMAHCYLLLQTNPSLSGSQPLMDIALLRYESAWSGQLKKSEKLVQAGRKKAEYALSRGVDELCFFLTRTNNLL